MNPPLGLAVGGRGPPLAAMVALACLALALFLFPVAASRAMFAFSASVEVLVLDPAGMPVPDAGVLLDFDPYVLIFIVFMPTKGTPMEAISPPPVEGVVNLFRYARRRFSGEIALGCMRPPEYKKKLDEIILKEGLADRIAVPRWQIAEKYGLKKVPACCSIPKEFLSLFE